MACASATRSRTFSGNTSSLRITRPGSSALVEIWSVSTMHHSPNAVAPSGAVIRYSAATSECGAYRPADFAAARRATASGSDSANVRPRLSGARCGISTPSALDGLAATIAVISASSANSS